MDLVEVVVVVDHLQEVVVVLPADEEVVVVVVMEGVEVDVEEVDEVVVEVVGTSAFFVLSSSSYKDGWKTITTII